MKKIHFVTTNPEKLRRLEYALKKVNVQDVEVVQRKIELPEPRSDEIREIATQKARYAYDELRRPCVIEDSGFFIFSLNGFPGAFINFVIKKIGVEGILRLTEDKPRECEFRQCLAYTNPSLYPSLQYFESTSPGTLALEPSSKKSTWELHRIFVPKSYDKVLAEMTSKERENRRAKIKNHYMQFAEWLSTQPTK